MAVALAASKPCRSSNRHRCSGLRWFAARAAIFLLLATFTRAQDSQFFFDANGNLFVQTAAATAPPQIIGQPQNRMVAPGESASFFVVAKDTRGSPTNGGSTA
jgi:hypothetical protein